MSSLVSIDHDAGVDSMRSKRRLSVNSLSESEATCKFPRVAYKLPQLRDAEGAHLAENSEDDFSENRTSLDDANAHSGHDLARKHPKTNDEAQAGTSISAINSRKLRKAIASGTYVPKKKRVKSWKEKITNLDPGALFDKSNSRKILHSRCSTWILAKDTGDTTRFKQHVEDCHVKPIPAHGTLMGMGWLKTTKNIETGSGRRSERRESGKNVTVKMPCRGVSDMDNLSVDRYLRRTGAGGGGGRSIHVISRERFKKEFRYLTRTQKEEVQAAQKAEWSWRNDSTDLRVYATNCERFTSSHSLILSLCTKCEDLLTFKAFTDAIRKKTPLDKNLKYTNTQYLHPVLARIYKNAKGLRMIIEGSVSGAERTFNLLIHSKLLGCKFYTMYQVC